MHEASRLQIDSVRTSGGGRIGLCACPGGRGVLMPGVEIDLEHDLETLLDWGAVGLVSLIEQAEFEVLMVTTLPMRARELGLWWRHLPIRDMCAPDAQFESRWSLEGTRLRGLLCQGASVAIHCWAGLGRTGTVAARLLVELGTEPAQAMRAVRKARPGAIQSVEQEAHVMACKAIA